jgi:hypothetical protein
VQMWPRETWKVLPEIYEDDDPEVMTPFEEDWDALGYALRGKSWYKSQEYQGHPVWEYLRRLDEQAGIGRYGVLLFGFDDANSNDLSKPVKSKPGTKLLFLRVFPESLAQVSKFDTDVMSERFGQPNEYLLTFNSPNDSGGSEGGTSSRTLNVHWSRVLHLCDNLDHSEWSGTPRQEPVLDNLLSLKKLYGGSGEMYWRGAFPGYSFETHPAMGGNVKIDKDKHKDMVEDWANGLQRYLTLIGMTAKSLAPQVVDPTPQVKVQLEAITVILEIPMRIFLGSERGELSSAQDSDEWDGRVRSRQDHHATARIIVPFVDRLILVGVLRAPTEAWYCKWPDMNAQTDDEKATVGQKRTAALVQYADSGAANQVTLSDFLTSFLGFTDEQAASIVENATRQQEDGSETGAAPLLGLVGGITGMIELFKLAQAGGMSEEQLKQQIMLFFGVDEARAEELLADGLPEPPPAPEPPVPNPIKLRPGEKLVPHPAGAGGGFGGGNDLFGANALSDVDWLVLFHNTQPTLRQILDAIQTINCGGPGSDIPGPCPTAKVAGASGGLKPAGEAHREVAAHVEKVVEGDPRLLAAAKKSASAVKSLYDQKLGGVPGIARLGVDAVLACSHSIDPWIYGQMMADSSPGKAAERLAMKATTHVAAYVYTKVKEMVTGSTTNAGSEGMPVTNRTYTDAEVDEMTTRTLEFMNGMVEIYGADAFPPIPSFKELRRNIASRLTVVSTAPTQGV